MDFKLELVVVPVSDVDRAKTFYADQMSFTVDVDHAPNEHFRVVQLTPPGSACSITIGKGLTKAEPGTYQGLHLVVIDGDSTFRAFKFDVLRIVDGRIAEITTFGPALFPVFGLPSTL